MITPAPAAMTVTFALATVAFQARVIVYIESVRLQNQLKVQSHEYESGFIRYCMAPYEEDPAAFFTNRADMQENGSCRFRSSNARTLRCSNAGGVRQPLCMGPGVLTDRLPDTRWRGLGERGWTRTMLDHVWSVLPMVVRDTGRVGAAWDLGAGYCLVWRTPYPSWGGGQRLKKFVHLKHSLVNFIFPLRRVGGFGWLGPQTPPRPPRSLSNSLLGGFNHRHREGPDAFVTGML